MALQSVRAAEIQQMAENFRVRAAETQDTVYHRLMLRTALELEDLAERLKRSGGAELVLADDEASS